MYWLRTGNPLDPIAGLLLILLWWAGGWLLALHAFELRRRDSLLAGLGIGALLFIVFSNLLAHFLPLTPAFWVAGLVVQALGLGAFWQAPDRNERWRGGLLGWPPVIVFAGLVALFTLINQGLAIFDDFHNLPLVSVMAAGDVPPHFYLNPEQKLAYHYGLHLFAASLVRVGGLFPWSAFDLAKAFSLALAVSLAWLWFRRTTGSRLAAVLGALLALFGGGTRWLLLFAPGPWLARWASGLQLLGSAAASGPDLYTLLASPWKIEGGGPLAFPFAFANGITPPLLLALGGPGALPGMTCALLLLLARRRWRPPAAGRPGQSLLLARWRPLPAVLFALLLASLALSGEHLFGMAWAGLALAALLKWRSRWSREERFTWVAILAASALLAFASGGVITEAGRSLFSAGEGGGSFGFAGFGLRWPPALLSAHLGPLALANPGQLIIALAETGPLVLLLAWVLYKTGSQIRRGRRVWAGLALGALLGLGLPLLVRYGVERDISRLTGSAMFLAILLGFPLAWMALRRGARSTQALLGAAYLVAILGGLALFNIELIAISRPQLTYYVQETDARLAQSTWDRLPGEAQVLDLSTPYRAVTLFGRPAGRAYLDLYNPLPEWQDLVATPDPARLAAAGYAYVYLDKTAWQSLKPEGKAAFQRPCARLVAEETTDLNDFRRLVDIRDCNPATEIIP